MSRPLPLHYLAWACVLLPVVAVHVGYLISIAYGAAPACLPYAQGCVSVSGAVRNEPAIHFYRALTLPAAGLTFAFWILLGRWLETVGGTRDRALVAIGLVGTAFMVLYAVFLGTDGAVYAKLRRYGIWFYFGLTFLAQLMLVRRLLAWRDRLPAGPVFVLDWMARFLLLVGLASVPATQLWEIKWAANVLEWIGALTMMAILAGVAELWRRAGFAARVEARR